MKTIKEKLREDITERERMEEALQVEKNKLQSVVGAMEYGLTIQDTDYNIIYQNEPQRATFGDHLGEKCYRVYEGNERVCEGCPVEKAFKDGKSHTSERRSVLPSGEVTFWENTANPIRDAGGRIISCLEITRNITERKRMEEALLESEEQFRSIVENSQAGIMILDGAYRLIYVNDELCRVSGYSREEVIGQDFRQFLDEEARQLAAERYIRRQRGEEVPPRYEFNIIRKDGQKRRVELSSNVIKDSAGKVKTVAQILDITERKQAEEALQAEKNKLQSLVDAMEDGLTILDKDYNLIYQNETIRRIFGEHLGEKCYRVYEGREEACEGCPVEKAFRDGRSHISERRTVTPSGEVAFWENTANPVRDAGGRIVSCLELGRNITKRKQAEEALLESESKFKNLFEHAKDAIFLADAQTGILVDVNPAACHMLGLPKKKVVGMRQSELHPPEVVDHYKRIFRNHVEKGITATEDLIVQRADGSQVPVDISASVFELGGKRIIQGVFRDITERKQAEEALRESEVFNSSLLENSPNPIEVINPDTSVRYVNPAFEKLTGFTLVEMAGKKTPHPWWPEESREEIVASLKRTIACGGRRKERERVFQKKNGERFWVAINSAPVMHNGKLIYILLNWVDITERKRMEQALRESEEKFSKAFRSSPSDSITLTRLRDSLFIEVNDNFLHTTGYTREELINHRSTEIGIWAKAEDRARMVQILKEQGRVHNEEFAFRMKSGEIRQALFSAELIDIGGEPCVISMTIDISGLRKAERALERQKAYFQQLFDNSPDAIAWVDAADRFVNVNKGFETLFGYRTEEIKGRFINDTIAPEDRMEEASALSQARFSNKVVRKETVRKRKDGNLVDVSVLGYPIRLGKETVGAYAIYTDITPRKQAEEREKQLQQELYLSRRLASIGELAAGVAHEINNPLTGVLGFSQRLLRKSTSEEVSRDLEIIHSEAQRAAEVVRNLLTFARRREPKKEYANINDIVQKALELRGYALQTGNIEVMTDLAPSLPKIMVDFPQIQEVFLNIILNAEHAMNEAHGEGKLIIKTREVKDYVRISFADDGPGIPPEQLDKVFDPFFTTRAEKGGTGLGLSACHGIVTEHGGRIYARSKPGKGATFFVELPLSLIETTVGRRF